MIVVNPLVPYVNDFQKVIPTMLGSRVRRVSDMGFAQSATRRSSCSPTSGCMRPSSSGRRSYPGVDIILIEPDPNDELMFDTNIMNFTKRVEIARHGFESVTLKLANDYDELREICAPARDRDLGHPRPQGRPPFCQRSGEDRRLAPDPGADDGGAPAPVRPGVATTASRVR